MVRLQRACAVCRRSFLASAFLTFATLKLVNGERNVTVASSDPVLQYAPQDAWHILQDQSIGDGTAKLTSQAGASVTLEFIGTAVYFQTTRTPQHGVATVELDGSPFKLDSSSSGNNVGSGVVWGVVSLKDAKHTLVISQSSTAGTELTVNAFVYTTNEDPETSHSAPLDPSNDNYVRNTALIGAGAGILAFILGIASFFCYRRRKSRKNEQASIRLQQTLTTPTSALKQFPTGIVMSATGTVFSVGSRQSHPLLHVDPHYPEDRQYSNEFSHGPAQIDMNDPEAVRQARTLHPLVVGQQFMGPESANTSADSLSAVLPAISRSRGTNSSYAETSRAVSGSSWQGPSEPTSPRASSSQTAGPSTDLTPAEPEDKNTLARRLREVASVASSRFPAGFVSIRAPSPPPAYAERSTASFSRTGTSRQSRKGSERGGGTL